MTIDIDNQLLTCIVLYFDQSRQWVSGSWVKWVNKCEYGSHGSLDPWWRV